MAFSSTPPVRQKKKKRGNSSSDNSDAEDDFEATQAAKLKRTIVDLVNSDDDDDDQDSHQDEGDGAPEAYRCRPVDLPFPGAVDFNEAKGSKYCVDGYSPDLPPLVILVDTEGNPRINQIAAKVLVGSSSMQRPSFDGTPSQDCFNKLVDTQVDGIDRSRTNPYRGHADPFPEVWSEFCEWLEAVQARNAANAAAMNDSNEVNHYRRQQKCVFVAHNVIYDLNMIAGELRRCGRAERGLSSLGFTATLCTWRLLQDVWKKKKKKKTKTGKEKYSRGSSRNKDQGIPPCYQQGFIYEHLFGRGMRRPHDAKFDVIHLHEILESPQIAPRWRAVALQKQEPFPRAHWSDL